MFEGFKLARIDTGEAEIHVRHGGVGPPIMLLHGHPRTHATWEWVAPMLAQRFTVFCPDLRGYGKSSKPATTATHEPYSKRAMARDCFAVMDEFGHARFSIAGHDRGAYVAFRAALDRPERIAKLAVLDAVPIVEAFERCNAQFALDWWHWFFFAQPAPMPERVIGTDPDAWYMPSRRFKSEEGFQDYYEAIHNKETIHAMLEDYRAGATIDRFHDIVDRDSGNTLQCPTLVVHAKRDDMERLYGDPLEPWRTWAGDLRGCSIDAGHHMAEEAPTILAGVLQSFFL